MKIKQLVIAVVMLLTARSNAQIKIFSGGSIAYGSTTAPYSGEKHHFSGDVMISSLPTISLSCIFLRGSNGWSGNTTPDYSWTNDNQTGLFHPASNVIGVTIGGSEKFRFNTSCQFLSVNTTSSASTPDFSWNGDVNTGVFHPANDVLGFSTGGSERVRIDANGKLGIGTTSPSEKLHVVGNSILSGTTRFDGWTDIITDWSAPYGSAIMYPEQDWYFHLGTSSYYLGDAYITHILTKNSITFTSDQSVKQNINYDLSSVITKLKQVKPASYNFKSNLAPGAPPAVKNKISAVTEYGCIAQDLISVFPELVELDATTGLYGVKYIEFIPLLINAFNFQQSELDSLKTQLNECCSKSGSQRINTNPGFGNNGENYDGNSYIKQNSPNPFSKETLIEFFIAEKNANSSVLVFDMNGKLLKTLKLEGNGKGSVTITGSDFQPGMYYYSLIINNKEIDTKKMILTE